jgi:hypothetical protein
MTFVGCGGLTQFGSSAGGSILAPEPRAYDADIRGSEAHAYHADAGRRRDAPPLVAS